MKAHGHATLSMRVIAPLLRALAETDVDLADLLRAADIEPADVDDASARIPHTVASKLLREAVRVTGDEALGLRAAEHVQPGDLGVIEYTARSSRTFLEAIETVNRYLELAHDSATFSVRDEGDSLVWSFHFPTELPMPSAASEFLVALLLRIGLQMSPGADVVTRVTFRHAPPEDQSTHRSLIGVPIEWNSPVDALVLDARLANGPLAPIDPAFVQVLRRHADGLVDQIRRSERFSSRVRGILLSEISGGDAGIDVVATRLHMSVRTLRRRLDGEGSSYSALKDDVRRDLAIQYLENEDVSIGELSYLLGFTSRSAFHTAFKRWTSMTPAEYRRRSGQPKRSA